MNIPFNAPHLTGKETEYMIEAVNRGKLSGNGEYTKRCQAFFEQRYGYKKCLLTTSGTDALEMCAMLCDLQPGDEVIVPSYTFVSTALAFLREGAKVVFADSGKNNPNIDPELIESLITPRTKVIAPVHYAGIACDMDAIMALAEKYNLLVVEDDAQGLDSYYKPKSNSPLALRGKGAWDRVVLPLGGIGHLAAISFHETKNITAGGEGGLLIINDERFIRRAEILWEKGTNRAEFFRGEVNKYGWVDMGSSFLPAEINAAFLWAQLEHLDEIQDKRKQLWNRYWELLKPLADKGYFELPKNNDGSLIEPLSLSVAPYGETNGRGCNAHMFYLVFPDLEKRTKFIAHLKEAGILSVFHYLSLHKSAYYTRRIEREGISLAHYGEREGDRGYLPECDRYADCLVRLPMFYDLTIEQVEEICGVIKEWTENMGRI